MAKKKRGITYECPFKEQGCLIGSYKPNARLQNHMKKCHGTWCYEDEKWLVLTPDSQEATEHIVSCEECGLIRGLRPHPFLGNNIILVIVILLILYLV